MLFSLVTVLSALIPVFTYSTKRVVDHFTGGPAPSNADEAIALGKADVEKLKALASLDDATGASQWVVNIRSLMRPFAVITILATWTYIAITTGAISVELVSDLASCAVFYLFGDRTMMHISERKK